MVEKFAKSSVLIIYLSQLSDIIDWWHYSSLMEDYKWKIARQCINWLPKSNVSATKHLMVKMVLLSPYLGL